MRRYGHLWEGMISFENLLRAAEKARRGKRFKPGVARFFFNLERELVRLHDELRSMTYRPGPYRTFMIYEGKPRQISAAPFRDHALTGVLDPIFERSFVYDSYACRKGKGTHAAVDRCQAFARHHAFVLKADVRRFFPSIDHEILKSQIARRIKDPHVLSLVNMIVDHSNPQPSVIAWFPGDDLFTPTERRRGLPLGNQTSQFFANVYLDPLDHFVMDRLGLSYVRYVDDFLVFSETNRRTSARRTVTGTSRRTVTTTTGSAPPVLGNGISIPYGQNSRSSLRSRSVQPSLGRRPVSGMSSCPAE
jgi:Reverse transcriptase (RNA-dependent DNA polymerase)